MIIDGVLKDSKLEWRTRHTLVSGRGNLHIRDGISDFFSILFWFAYYECAPLLFITTKRLYFCFVSAVVDSSTYSLLLLMTT